MLSTIVGDDSGSRFFWTLVDSGRAECAVMYSYEYQGTGMYMSMLCGAPEDTADNLQEMFDTLRVVQQDGVTADELTQAKNKICSHVVLQSERPTNRLFALGRKLAAAAWLPVRPGSRRLPIRRSPATTWRRFSSPFHSRVTARWPSDLCELEIPEKCPESLTRCALETRVMIH